MAGDFTASIGGEGYELDWEGLAVLETAALAAKLAIDDVTIMAVDIAREEHEWENRTGQTEAALFRKDAVEEFSPRDDVGAPHVWGEWGVEDRPRFDSDGNLEGVTTKDVALFLEFGTVRMAARPWLYPAWDQSKILLLPLMKAHYAGLSDVPSPRRGLGSRVGSFFRGFA